MKKWKIALIIVLIAIVAISLAVFAVTLFGHPEFPEGPGLYMKAIPLAEPPLSYTVLQEPIDSYLLDAITNGTWVWLPYPYKYEDPAILQGSNPNVKYGDKYYWIRFLFVDMAPP